jgi:purine-nucleoside/S-methyl-5'-thioadenosine phosphorylase / adenosine deaminase
MSSEEPPTPASGFSWVAAPWGIQLRAAALGDFVHGWTCRQLQLRGPGETTGWRMLAEAAGVAPEDLVGLRQVHRTGVHRVVAARRPDTPPEADIVIADDRRAAVAVQVADCVPLLLGDSSAGLAAAAHAGWRGTLAGAAGTAVARFAESGHDPANLVAAVGPSIGPCCYRVGREVREAFAERWPVAADPWFDSRDGELFLDLWTANRDQLQRAGVAPGNVFVSALCTACHPGWFFSYRRDGPGDGRMAGYIRSVLPRAR